jgi:short-subunit dehydrogenase
VVITGATSAVGRALSHELFQSECKLVLCARKKDDLEDLKREILNSAKVGPGFE